MSVMVHVAVCRTVHVFVASDGISTTMVPPTTSISSPAMPPFEVHYRSTLACSRSMLLSVGGRRCWCCPSWVKYEIAQAREKQTTTNHRVLVPIALVSFERIKASKDFNADLGEETTRVVRAFYRKTSARGSGLMTIGRRSTGCLATYLPSQPIRANPARELVRDAREAHEVSADEEDSRHCTRGTARLVPRVVVS